MLIEYDDKDKTLPTSNPRRIWRDIDANEVKEVVNTNAITTVTPDVTGDIDIPLTNLEMIVILGNISGNKTFTFTGSVSKKLNIKIPMTAIANLTFPASVVMADSRWNGGFWRPDETGLYHGTAFFDGVNWFLTIPQLPSV